MLKAEAKKIVIARLDEVFKPLGYKRKLTDGIDYFRVTEQHTDAFYALLTRDAIEGSGYYRGYTEVNEILFAVKEQLSRPFFVFWDEKKTHLITIYDYSVVNEWGAYGEEAFTVKYRKWLSIDSPKALNDYLDWYISYLLGEGKEFLDYYAYLPNILKKMDELDKTNTYWGEKEIGILAHASDPYFSGLVISKLCNDPKFDEKLERLNAYYSKDENEDDLYAFEKLKEILERVEPRYNV